MLRRLVGGAAAARSPPPPAFRRLLHTGGGGGCSSGEPESVAYRMSMLQRPSSVRRKGLTWNSCSLIGRLAAPVRPCGSSSDEYPRAYTFLSVTPSLTPSSLASSSTSSNFEVTLQMKGDLAKVSLKYLKHRDLVYVSGLLGSYHKVGPSGERYIVYKIYVDELNYVLDPNKKLQNDAESISPSSMPSVTTQMLKENECIDRLRLWQVFFASPYEEGSLHGRRRDHCSTTYARRGQGRRRRADAEREREGRGRDLDGGVVRSAGWGGRSRALQELGSFVPGRGNKQGLAGTPCIAPTDRSTARTWARAPGGWGYEPAIQNAGGTSLV